MKKSFLIAIGIATVIIVIIAYSSISKVSDESAQRALISEAIKHIEEYHDKQNKYPKSLDVFEFSFNDGGNKKMLKDIHYSVTNTGYEIYCIGYSTKEKIGHYEF